MPQLTGPKKKKPFFNIAQAMQVADAIADPVAKQKEYERIQRLVIGTEPQPSPARVATTAPVLAPKPTPTIRQPQPTHTQQFSPSIQVTTPQSRNGPTVEAAAEQMRAVEDQARLVQEIELVEKMQPKKSMGKNGAVWKQRQAAYSDPELEAIIGGFAGPEEAAAAQEEATARKRIDEKGLSKLFDPTYINRLAGNVVGGAANMVTSDPINLAGVLALGGETILGGGNGRAGPQPGVDLHSDEILGIGADVRRDVNSLIGISEPRDMGESAATLLAALTPIGGPAASRAALSGRSLLEVATPFVIGAGPGRVAANFATAAVAEQAIREVADDATSPYKTAFDQLGLQQPETDVAYPEALANIAAGVAMLTGASFVPAVVAQQMRIKRGNKPPTIQDVYKLDIHGPKGLKTMETAGDLAMAMMVDKQSVLSGWARRAGVADPDLITRLIDNDTHVAGVMRRNEAMRTGNLNTYGGRWHVDITPGRLKAEILRLPPAMQKDIDDYMKYSNLVDVMRERIAKKIDPNEAIHILTQVTKSLSTIRQRTPIVDQIAKQYQHITAATRDYLSQGPNAMISLKAKQQLGVMSKNFVPNSMTHVDPSQSLFNRLADSNRPVDQKELDAWYLQKRDLANIDGNIDGQRSVFDSLEEYVSNALRAKMEHDVRGAYINAMRTSKHGSDTLIPATPKQARKHSGRIVNVYEQGKRVPYLSSKLQAQLLKLDPYVAKHQILYSLKRGLEATLTGPVTAATALGGFAPTTLMRDALGGMVFMPKGYKGPIGRSLFTAIPKIVWAKMQLAAIDTLSNKDPTYMPFLSPQTKDALAFHQSQAYMNSLYHAFNAAGGVDASLVRTSVESGKNMLVEVEKSADWLMRKMPGLQTGGHSLAVLARGMGVLFDAISEAPRFATAEANVRRGMSTTDAVREARKITGDNTRSGNVYDPRGVRYDVDAVNKGKAGVVGMIAPAVSLLQEGTPYLNPMIQGIRRLGERLIDNPVEVNLKAWAMLGLPSLMMLGWNEMLGPEYNEFAFNQRSSNDISMRLYVGVPGMPENRGIQIPIPHELTPWKSTFETGVYSLMKGAEGDEVRSIMKHMMWANLGNMGMVGFPQVLGITNAMQGHSSPQTINPFSWKEDSFELREDNVGLFPQNVEAMFRSMFGNVSELVMNTSAAAWEGGPDAFFDELKANVIKNTPIVKNVAGSTVPVSNFTPLSERKQKKVKALREFFSMYEEHIDPSRQGVFRKTPMETAKGVVDDNDPVYSRAHMGPLRTPRPTNPLLFTYGPLIKATLDGNEDGYKGLSERYTTLSKQLELLRAYHAGRKDKFKEWQKEYTGVDKEYQKLMGPLQAEFDAIPKDPDGSSTKGFGKAYDKAKKKIDQLNAQMGELAKNDRLINGMNLDLSNRYDVKRLIGVLEKERSELMLHQAKMIDSIEDHVNQDLKVRGLLMPGQRFLLDKHLGSFLQPGLLLDPEVRQMGVR